MTQDPKARIDKDKTTVLEMFNQIGADVTTIVRATRIGKKQERPRPLKITLADEHDQKTVRKAAHMLEHTEDFNSIAIAPDMTQEERVERRVLVKELRRRKDNGEKNLAIRKGAIVTLPTDEEAEELSVQGDDTTAGDGEA